MKCCCSPLADKRFLFFAFLASGAFVLTQYTPWTRSKSTTPLQLPPPLQQVAASQEQGYSLTDGKVVYDGAATTTIDDGAPTEPGNIDVVDIAKANAIAVQKGMGKANSRVFKTTVAPQWYAENTRFWYRNDLKDGTKEFIVVDAEKGARMPAFDHEKLAVGLTKATDTKYEAKKLPFQTIEFVDVDKAVRFGVGDKFWQCDLASYECKPSASGPKAEIDPPAEPNDDVRDYSENSYDPLPAGELSPDEWAELEQEQAQKKGAGQKKGGGGKGFAPTAVFGNAKSSDGKWTAFIKDHNAWLRDANGKETQLTQAGVEGDAFNAFTWAPDSKVVVAYRSTPGDNKTVYRIETSPTDQLYARLHEKGYPRAMDKMSTHEPWLIDVENMKAIKVDVDRIDFRGIPRLRWSKDNATFTFEKTDRGHQRFRVIEVSARTGATRNIIDEKSDSMVNHYSDGVKNDTFYLQYLDDSQELVYLSEMDGWKHLYLIDAKAGKIKHQMTKGEWVVRKINKMDVEKRQMWFQASGIFPDQDPYLIHFCRVNFDGTGFVVMTKGNGNNSVQYSPDNKYLIATYSRVDMAPVHELRRVSDGSKVCDVDKADISALEATGWRFPEVFVAKGRDGKTDIWGYVVRPSNFDPNKKYPVIENIYAGPHSSHVRKTFSAAEPLQAMADLGFILVKIEGMGTMNRSRAFHAVCWQNLKDAGFPDRILWMKALAAKYAYVDIDRVGIYGTSAGGQNACGAVLLHPEFYKVAVASCGCHDNRLDKSSWNEAWMGKYGPHYEASSNITLAPKLQGHLLLIVGEMDTNVPPESTYRVVDALIKAGKDFDLIVVPGLGHSNGGPHGDRRRIDYFRQHLQGVQPPNHNAKGAKAAGV
jgi:dipeptidyl aminopeptidase/acylaminoacyl peptidase